MPNSIYVHERARRVLWPGEQPPEPKVAGSKGKITGKAMSFASGSHEIQFSIPPIKIGPRSFKYVKLKVILGGVLKWKMPILNDEANANWNFGSELAGTPGEKAKAAVKVEKALTEHLTAELGADIPLEKDDIDRMAASLKDRNWNGVAKQILSVKLKGGEKLSKYVSFAWELDISPDDDGCFFGATGKLVGAAKLDQLLKGAPSGFAAEYEASVSIRFNLSEAAWKLIAQRIGGPLVRSAVLAIGSHAVRVVLLNALTVAGIFAIVAVSGLAIAFGALYMAVAAREEGRQLGVLFSYSLGYISRVSVENGLDERTKRELRRKGLNSPDRMLGWQDASFAIDKHGSRTIQRLVIYHFGSTWERKGIMDGGLWDGTPVNIRSRVGKAVDTEGEVTALSLRMAKQVQRQIDEFVDYCERRYVKGLGGMAR